MRNGTRNGAHSQAGNAESSESNADTNYLTKADALADKISEVAAAYDGNLKNDENHTNAPADVFVNRVDVLAEE